MPRRRTASRALLTWMALLLLLLVAPACAPVAGEAGAKAPQNPGTMKTAMEPAAAVEEMDGAEMEPQAAAFGGPPPDATRLAQSAAPMRKDAGPAAAPAPAADAARPPPPPAVSDAPNMASPLLIYTALLHVSTFETNKALDQVQKLALDAGGYLVSRDDISITIRVPSDRFSAALEGVMKVGDVLHRNVSARDVTEEFYDLQTRLQNAEAVLARLTELLRRAEKVGDALAVERELQRVAEQVERLKGRLKLLRELVAFSTISVRFEPRTVETVDSKVTLPFPWLDSLGLGSLLSL